MNPLSTCIVCDSPDHRLLYPSTYKGTVEDAHEYFLAHRKASAHGDIRACQRCGFVFTSPQFEPHEYDRIYSRIGNEGPPGQALQGPGAAAAQARFGRLKDAVARHADLNSPFLDFGCGNGDFLQAVGSGSSLGFEIGPPGRRTGLCGSAIVSGLWTQVAGSAAVPWGSLAFVTAFDVFEHLPSLQRDVELVRRVLRPGGHLFVTVPDIGSPLARASGRKWNMLLLEHLWYFKASTLDKLLGGLGFKALEHRAVPYDAALGHIAKRLGESAGVRLPRLPQWLDRAVIAAPAGVLFAAYRRKDD